MNQPIETVQKNSHHDSGLLELTKQKLRENFTDLTDEDLSLEEGKEDGLIEKINSQIEVAVSKTKEGLHELIKVL